MTPTRPPVNFEDERGVIRDLLTEPVDAITRIGTRKDAVRGNHIHERTTQWTYVLSGMLLMANGGAMFNVGPGEIVRHDPGHAHAWRALVDTECLVFTRGPRSGEGYESDTQRLAVPLLT
jgi:mannose-6-phosphate isomerase-like protein (cupin superfamily)